MEALRREGALVEALEGDGGTVRLVPTPSYSPLASWVAAQAPTGHAWGWLRWQSGRHWAEFLQASAWRTEPSARPGAPSRLVPDAALLATGRIRYFLLEAGTGPRALPAPWQLLRSHARFSVWEQPELAPMAQAYGAYVLVADESASAVPVVDRAVRENALVISASGALAERADLRKGARAILPAVGERAREDPDEPSPRDGAWGERLRNPPVRPPLEVAYRREAPERIALEVPSGAGPAMVFVSEGYHPWWRATVDGEAAPVLRAQLAFLAVPVGPGRPRIEFELETPALVSAARRITASAWIALALGAPVAALARGRRPPAPRGPG
jgi:hypothetical protein